MEPTKPMNLVAGGGTATQKASSEIARLIDHLQNATMNLQDNTVGLQDALRPVLRNEPTDANPASEIDCTTDLGNVLAVIISRVEATNRVVLDSRDRVEL